MPSDAAVHPNQARHGASGRHPAKRVDKSCSGVEPSFFLLHERVACMTMKRAMAGAWFLLLAGGGCADPMNPAQAGDATDEQASRDENGDEIWSQAEASVIGGVCTATLGAKDKILVIDVVEGIDFATIKLAARAGDSALMVNGIPLQTGTPAKIVKVSDPKKVVIRDYIDGNDLVTGQSSTTVLLDLAVAGPSTVELQLRSIDGMTDRLLVRGTGAADQWSMKPTGEIVAGKTTISRVAPLGWATSGAFNKNEFGSMRVDLLLGGGADSWDGSKFLSNSAVPATGGYWNSSGVDGAAVSRTTFQEVYGNANGFPEMRDNASINVVGGTGSDTFTGGALNEIFYGGAGDDTFKSSGGGSDIALGGSGDDLFQPGSLGLATVKVGTVTASYQSLRSPPDFLDAGLGNDTLDFGAAGIADGMPMVTGWDLPEEPPSYGQAYAPPAKTTGKLNHVDIVSGANAEGWEGEWSELREKYLNDMGWETCFAQHCFNDTQFGVVGLNANSDFGSIGTPVIYTVSAFEKVVSPDTRVQFVGRGEPVTFVQSSKKFSDVISSGSIISYEKRSAAVTVDLSDPSGLAGELGEGDRVSRFLGVIGGGGADKLTASSACFGWICEFAQESWSPFGRWSRLEGRKGDDTLVGGSWHDDLIGGDGNDILRGNDGSDFLDGGAGLDELRGGAGHDLLDGGLGADKLDGGDGVDLVTYATRTKGVVIALNQQSSTSTFPTTPNPLTAVQGEPREGDVFFSIEGGFGGSGADRLVASDQTEPVQLLCGGAGSDTLVAAQRTVAIGGAGDDSFEVSSTSTEPHLYGDRPDNWEYLENGYGYNVGYWNSSPWVAREQLSDFFGGYEDMGATYWYVSFAQAGSDNGPDGDDYFYFANPLPGEGPMMEIRSCGGGTDLIDSSGGNVGYGQRCSLVDD
jgi:Ca2+-binding RTX toxin-like protein